MTTHAQALATAVTAELVAAGITDCVVCPGSRSAPLALAAARTPNLRLHVRLDERGGSFFALGLARATGKPVAVIVTSGTAVANCLPAMVEAHYSNHPLVIVSADRPGHLIGMGASQTIDQAGLFEPFAPCVETESGMEPPQAAALIRKALAEHHRVQLNIGLDQPLLAGDGDMDESEEKEKAHVQPHTFSHVSNRRDWGSARIDLGKRTLVIAGDNAVEIPALAKVPTIAEPTVPAPLFPVHPLAASFFAVDKVGVPRCGAEKDTDLRISLKPEQIIVTGHVTLHRAVLALLHDPDICVTVVTDQPTYCDAAGTASRVVSDIDTAGSACTREWLTICRAVSDVAADAVREALGENKFGFTGLHVAAAVADSLNAGDTLLSGSSNPVRDLSFVGLPFDGVTTHSPRGAAGIDGTISQAVGIAVAVGRRYPDEIRAPRTVALVGDLTFLHDVTGLIIPDGSPRPEDLTIVVANDCGGGIFESLESGGMKNRDRFEQIFGTPHPAQVEQLATGCGVNYKKATDLPQLVDLLAETTAAPDGITVIEAVTDRATRRDLHTFLHSKVTLNGQGG